MDTIFYTDSSAGIIVPCLVSIPELNVSLHRVSTVGSIDGMVRWCFQVLNGLPVPPVPSQALIDLTITSCSITSSAFALLGVWKAHSC